MKWLITTIIIVFILFVLYTYSFIDAGLVLTQNQFLVTLFSFFINKYQLYRFNFAIIYVATISLLFLFYIYLLKQCDRSKFSKPFVFLIPLILVFSYPAFSYDLFNYITTANVAYHYQENPYIVMPIEIPNDPNLKFTRASNKVALYGPVWIFFTFIPHFIGMQHIWLTIVSFKFFNYVLYLLMIIIIWKKTKQWENVCFFACNPLVLFETIINGHNDIFMMILAVSGILLLQRHGLKMIVGKILLICSILTKGATAILLPFIFFHISQNKIWKYMTVGLFLMFLLTPLREEMYPWYAVWFIVPISFISWKEWRIIKNIIVALTFGLLLRHAPYIATYNYGGEGPVLRLIFTCVPIIILFLYYCFKYLLNKSQIINFNDQTNSN